MQRDTASNKALKQFLIEVASKWGIVYAAQQAIKTGDVACVWRVNEEIREAGAFLIESGLPTHASAGLFYLGELEQASEFPDYFGERARLSINAVTFTTGDYSTAREVYEHLAKSEYPRIAGESRLMLATITGIAGDSARAVEELTSLSSLVRSPLFAGHLNNNLAMELLRMGEAEKAAQFSDLACANPLARINPTWFDTRRQIEEAIRERQRRMFSGASLLSLEAQRQFSVNALINNPSKMMVQGVYEIVRRF